MLAGDNERLEDYLIHLLAEKAASTVETLCAEIRARYRTYTIQAVYKELRKLQAEGVVVKARGLYSLRLSWIFAAADLVDKAYASYVDNPFPEDLLPGPKKKISWRFSDLKRADEFYMQLMTKLAINSNHEASYSIIDHPWYLFIAPRNEAKYQEILKQRGKHHYLIAENDSPLDRFQLKHYDEQLFSVAFYPEYELTRNTSIITVVGSYILHERLNAAVKRSFDDLYKRTRSPKELDHESVIRLITSPAPVTVMIEHSEAKARSWTNKIKALFL